MSKYPNSKKAKRIKKVENSLREELKKEFSKMSHRCKFNFSYIDVNQDGAVDFNNLNLRQLTELINKIRSFSKKSIQESSVSPHGGSPIYSNYGDFPKSSKFKHPEYVPTKVKWGRFRLEGDFRLAGFTVPYEIAKDINGLDENTFYVVFIDPEHHFYPSKKRHT